MASLFFVTDEAFENIQRYAFELAVFGHAECFIPDDSIVEITNVGEEI